MAISVHIIDSSKASLVMSSEVFKDKIPGTLVTFSLSAKEGLAHVQSKTGKDTPDALVIDFNLPDADGVTLIKELRKFYKGPIFMTAYPDKIVDYAVQEELFHYHDACCWIPKPVRYEALEKRIEQFLVNRHRLGKRFDVNFPSLLVGKGEGRGKRAPKFDGQLVNISMGGICIVFKDVAKLKRDEEFIVTMGVPAGAIDGAGAVSVLKPVLAAAKQAAKIPVAKVAVQSSKNLKLTPAQKAKEAAKLKSQAKGRKGATMQVETPTPALPMIEAIDPNLKLEEYKVKATVAWLSDGGRKVGLQFGKIPDSQRRQIEVFLKGLSA
jgi:CheY-like chemotaxis protein